MTIKTYYWDGTTLGDATEAPYDSATFFRQFSKVMLSDSGSGYILPGYNNNLKVTEAAVPAASVLVDTGALFAKGFIADNDASATLSITANASGNPRIDRVVLRITWATQTAAFVVIEGTSAPTPSVPALTQIYGTTWDIPLARIWVADGFATITDEEIHDEREFYPNTQAELLGSGNEIINSEFMGFNGIVSAPPGWDWTLGAAAPTAAVHATKPSQMSRGRAIQITSGGGTNGLKQTFKCLPSTMYSFKFLVNVGAGDTATAIVTTDSAAPNTITRTLRRVSTWVEHRIYYLTEADATEITFNINAPTTDIFQIAQCLAVQGYVPGPFRQIRETFFFDGGELTDGSWSGAVKSSGTTTIDLTADYSAYVLKGTRGLYVRAEAEDSGSAANPASMTVQNSAVSFTVWLFLDLNNHADNSKLTTNGWISLQKGATAFKIVIVASGALTLAPTLKILGMKV